jgi:uncharacterized protein involved in exopolysaccharide biosynthesis
MNIHGTLSRPGSSEQSELDAWRASFAAVLAQLINRRRLVALAICAGSAIGLLFSQLFPPTYVARANIYIDPRDNRAFSGDSSLAGQSDANAQINFVESQIGVIGSEPVLLRVVREEILGEKPSASNEPLASTQGLPSAEPTNDTNASQVDTPENSAKRQILESRALASLAKRTSITRAERSFLVEIAVKDRNPQVAARLANAIIKSYTELEDQSRAYGNRQLTTELANRLEDLRASVRDAQNKVETYRAQHNLLGDPEKVLLDQLSALMEHRQTTLATIAQLSATLGDRYPTLAAERGKLAAIDAQVKAKLSEIEAARKAEIELKVLQADANSTRKVFEAFETRYREASEFGRLKASNVRIISEARAPTTMSMARSLILWSVFGGIAAALLTLLWFVLSVMIDLPKGLAFLRENR